MKWFLDLTTRGKLFGGFGLIAIVNDLTEQSNLLAVNAAIEAAQAATQIAASSQQQMVGMDQVALAMENIEQASVQNVAGTKQAEVAAHSLHDLGQKLKQLAAPYKV